MEKRSTMSRPKANQTNPYSDFNSEVHLSRFQPGTSRTESSQQAVMPAMMTQVRASVRKPANPGIAPSSFWVRQRAVAFEASDRLRCANRAGAGLFILGIQLAGQSEIRKKNVQCRLSLSTWFRSGQSGICHFCPQ